MSEGWAGRPQCGRANLNTILSSSGALFSQEGQTSERREKGKRASSHTALFKRPRRTHVTIFAIVFIYLLQIYRTTNTDTHRDTHKRTKLVEINETRANTRVQNRHNIRSSVRLVRTHDISFMAHIGHGRWLPQHSRCSGARRRRREREGGGGWGGLSTRVQSKPWDVVWGEGRG